MISTLVVSALVCLAPEGAGDTPVPLYTNDDLLRMRAFRGQTGATSTPAVAPDPPAPRGERARSNGGESYWRREAERLSDRVRPLRARATDLRRRIDERRLAPGVRTLSDPQLAQWERDLAGIESTIAEFESRLEERARRAGALPGWLR